MSLTDPSTVRERGAINSVSYSGTVTDSQLAAAIVLASHTMMTEACGFDLYQSVIGLTDQQLADETPDAITGRTNAQKKADFIDAESYFAMMHIETVVLSGKLSATGRPMTAQTGRDLKTFAPAQDSTDASDSWRDRAFLCLRPYLTLTGTDSQNHPTYVASGNKRMIFTIF